MGSQRVGHDLVIKPPPKLRLLLRMNRAIGLITKNNF